MKIGAHLFYIRYNRLRFMWKGIKFGRNLRVYTHLYIRKKKNSEMIVGDNFTFATGDGYNPITANIRGYIRLDENAKIIVGNNSGLSSSTLWVKDSLTIGNNVQVGGGCLIMDNDCHSLDFRIRNGTVLDENRKLMDYQCAKSAPIVIEDDVLIGARSIVLKGVTIGARSIIGAGSVVVKSIPADCIAAGNPCVVIREISR